MSHFLSAPVNEAQAERDRLLGALVGLSHTIVNKPKTEDTDRVLASGLRLASNPDAAPDALRRMTAIVREEKHRVAPNCATCAMPCGNTSDYDMTRLWNAPEDVRTLKLRILNSLFRLAQGRPSEEMVPVIDQGLFVLAEDWDEELLLPIAERAEAACG